MALTAAIATAVATVCATVALGGAGAGGLLLPPVVMAFGLLPGIALAGSRPDRRTPATGREMRLVIIFTGVVALLLYVAGGPASSEHITSIVRLVILSVLPLSLLWPAPTIVRYCLLISVGCLVGAGSFLAQAPWPVVGVAAGTAVALVALNRITATSVPTLAPLARTPRRRMGTEALLLLAVAGLVGLLVSALLPPPDNSGGGGLESGDEAQEGGETAAYLNPSGQLDASGPGSGKGDEVLLRISAPAAAMWRSQTYDRWNGRTWSRSPAVDQLAGGGSPFGRGQFAGPPGIGDAEAFGERFVQRVRVEAGSAGLLVAAPRALVAELPQGRAVRSSRDGTMRAVPALGKGASYLVTSTRSTPSADQLRDAWPGPATAVDIPADVTGLYLQLPGVAPPVGDLATQLTAAAPTTYDKAKAIEDWLFSNTTVGRGTERLPAGVDPIERFLLVDKKGSAEQAASAMVVMLRSLGLPARVAVGFLPGDRYALGGEFVVRARHAHAWVEVWFPGLGWVEFDPSGRSTEIERDESVLDRLRRLLAAFWWVLAIALAVLVRWLTRRWLRRWQERRARPWVTKCYERLVLSGRVGGRPREPSETPAEYCTALAREADDGRLVEVGAAITTAAYSGREPPAETRAWVDKVVRETSPKLRQGPKRLEKTGRR